MKNFILQFRKSLIVCFILTSTYLIAQTTHTVNNNAGASTDFINLQAAIDAATIGDIIYVQHSPTTYGNITLNKGLTIIGRSNGDNGYTSTIEALYITGGASNSVIKGLNISSVGENGSAASLTDISFFDNDVSGTFRLGNTHTIDNTLIQGNIIKGAFYVNENMSNILATNNVILGNAMYLYTVDTLLFSNNVIAYNSGVNIYNYSNSGLLNINNSIFVINSTSNRIIDLNVGSGTIQIDNCITYNYNTTYTYNFETGAGITINGNVQTNINPLFTNVDTGVSASIGGTGTDYDPAIDDLTLQGSSTVTDDGLYQGYNFKPYGTPTGYPSIKVTSYSPTVPKNGDLSVTIEAKTN